MDYKIYNSRNLWSQLDDLQCAYVNDHYLQ